MYYHLGGLRTQSRPATFDSIDHFIGVNWILSLEHPCFSHVHNLADPVDAHSYMISSQLICTAEPGTSYEDPKDWLVSKAILTNILALSKAFLLEDEVTPVQAWYMIRAHKRFSGSDCSVLDNISSILSKTVKCHG